MRCEGDLKADDALHPAPEGRLPARDLELLGIKLYGRQRGVRADLLIRGGVLGPHFEPAFPAVCSIRKTVDSKAQIRQDLVIDDIVKKHGIRIEGFLRQDDAIIE
jgi:hypothetical protein